MAVGSANIRAGRAYIEIALDQSPLEKGLRKAQAKLSQFGTKISSAGRTMVATAALVSVPIGLAVKTFAQFDDQMRLVKAITGATAEEFEDLTNTAKKLGRNTSFKALDAALGMTVMARMGLTAKQIETMIPDILHLARATGAELPAAAQIAVNNMTVFGMKASEVTTAVDILTATANGSAQDLFELGESLKMASPQAAAAGDSFVNVAAALGVLANMGVRGSLAGTALRKAYSQFARDDVRSKLEAMGIAVVDVNGDLRAMPEIMAGIGQAMAKMPSAERLSFAEEIFDLRGSLAGLRLGGNINELNAFIQKLKNVDGIAKKTAEEMDSGIGGALRRLSSATESARIAIGKIIAEAWEPFIQSIYKGINQLADWCEANKDVVLTVTRVVTGVTILGTTLLVVGLAFKAMAMVVGTVMSVVMALNAVLTVHIAIIKGIAGLYGLIKTAILSAGTSVGFFRATCIALTVSFALVKGAIYALIGAFTGVSLVIKGVVITLGTIPAVMSGIVGIFVLIKTAIGGVNFAFIANTAIVMAWNTAIGLSNVIVFSLITTIGVCKAIILSLATAYTAVNLAIMGFNVSVATNTAIITAWNTIVGVCKTVILSITTAYTAANLAIMGFNVSVAANTAIITAWNTVVGVCKAILLPLTTAYTAANLAIMGFNVSVAANTALVTAWNAVVGVCKAILAPLATAYAVANLAIMGFNVSVAANTALVTTWNTVVGVCKTIILALTTAYTVANLAVMGFNVSIAASTAIVTVWNATIAISKALFISLQVLLSSLAAGFVAVKTAIQAMQIVQKTTIAIQAALNAAMSVGTTVVAGFTSAINLLKSALTALKAISIKQLARKMLPFVAYGTIIAGVIVILWKFRDAFGAVWDYIKGLGAQYAKIWGPIKDIVVKTFKVVKDALAMGNYIGAVKVGWAALKLVWLAGIMPLRKAWLELKNFLLDSWAIASNTVLGIGNSLWYGLLIGLKTVGNLLQNAWSDIWTEVLNAFDTTLSEIKKGWIRLKGLFNSEEVVNAQIEAENKELKATKEARTKQAEADKKQRQAELDALTKKKNEVAQKLDQKLLEDIAANKKAYEDAMEEASKNLTKAEIDWRNAMWEVKNQVEKKKEDLKNKNNDVVNANNGVNAASTQNATNIATGNWSLEALSQLIGTSSVAERTAVAAEHTEKINEKSLEEQKEQTRKLKEMLRKQTENRYYVYT